MSVRLPGPMRPIIPNMNILPPVQGYQMDPIESQIHQFFEQLVTCVRHKEEETLRIYRERRDEMLTKRQTRVKKEEELNGLKAETERRMVEEEIRGVLKQLMGEIDDKLAEVRASQPNTRMIFWGNHGNLIETIQNLGTVYEEEIPFVMRPLVAVGRRGEAPGELNKPWGLAIDGNTNRVYVVEGRETCRISVFSETGDFLNTVQDQYIGQPHGIVIHGDSMYVTDVRAHGVFQFKLSPDISLVNSLGGVGMGAGQFNCPLGLTVSQTGELFVADCNNNRVQIFEVSLNFKRQFISQSMRSPLDVKTSMEEVFVLCGTSPCIQVFSHAGETIRSIINSGIGQEVNNASFFCLDGNLNIIISDGGIDQIKTFTREGGRVRTRGGRGDQPGQFIECAGIAVSKNNRLAVVSYNPNFVLQIFSNE